MWYEELVNFLENLGMKKSDRDFHFSKYDMYDDNKKIGVKFYSIVERCAFSPEFDTIPSSAQYDAYLRAVKEEYHLISIFEHDWFKKKDKILSLFQDIYQSTSLYARNLILKKISSKDKKEFIEKYHISGDSVQGSIPYALYRDTELISVMTFGKLRGQSHSKYERSFELCRFVTKSGYRVIGGASKLFTAFLREYDPEYIICYSDNDFFTGHTYDKLGFKFLDYGRSINYNWVAYNDDYTDIISLSRQQCQPWRLKKQFSEIFSDFSGGSQEDYCMLSLGYSKLYRSGNSRREWCKYNV